MLSRLEIAIQENNLPALQKILTHPSKIDEANEYGFAPLHLACHHQKADIVSFLIDAGANPNAKAKQGHTPLHLACLFPRAVIVQTLLQAGSNVNATTKGKFTPMHMLGVKEELECAMIMIQKGADLSAKNIIGTTVLQRLIKKDAKSILYYLQKLVNQLPETQINQEDKKRLYAWVFRNSLAIQS